MKIKDAFERIGLNANVSIFGMNNKQDFVKLWNGTIEENMDFMHVPYGCYEAENIAIISKDGKEEKEIYLLFKYPKLTKKQREIVGKRAVGYPYETVDAVSENFVLSYVDKFNPYIAEQNPNGIPKVPEINKLLGELYKENKVWRNRRYCESQEDGESNKWFYDYHLKEQTNYLELPFNMDFENKLIKDYAKEAYEDFLSHATRRWLEPAYVVNKFISELQSLARKDGYIK